MKQLAAIWIAIALLIATAPLDAAQAQGAALQCGTWLYPRGTWIIGGTQPAFPDSSRPSTLQVAWLSAGTVTATYSFDQAGPLHSVTVNWSPGVVGNHIEFAELDVDSFRDNMAVEHRQFKFNDNNYITSSFIFTQAANKITLTMKSGTTVIPAYMALGSICFGGGGPNPPLGPTPTDVLPTSTAGGPTETPTLTPSPSRTPSPSPTPTATPTGSATPTSGASPTPGPSQTPGPGTPINANGGGFSTIPAPPACGGVLDPCGINPFMPGGPQALSTFTINTLVPITPVGTIPTSTLVSGSGPTTTATLDLTATDSGAVGAVSFYATGIAGINAGIAGTPGLLGANGSTLIDVANGSNEIGGFIGNFFALARALQSFFLGKTGTIVAFALLIVGFITAVRIIMFLVPILIGLFKIFLQLIGAIIP